MGEPEDYICCVIKGSASRLRRDILTLECFAYESLRLAPNSGVKPQFERNSHVNPLQVFFLRAVVGLAFATFVTRVFYGSINPYYVVGLAIILVGLAYLAEFLRHRKSR
jgi:hypothetical protein